MECSHLLHHRLVSKHLSKFLLCSPAAAGPARTSGAGARRDVGTAYFAAPAALLIRQQRRGKKQPTPPTGHQVAANESFKMHGDNRVPADIISGISGEIYGRSFGVGRDSAAAVSRGGDVTGLSCDVGDRRPATARLRPKRLRASVGTDQIRPGPEWPDAAF